MFGVHGGLQVVGHLGDVVAHDHVSALRVGGGDLFVFGFSQLLFEPHVFRPAFLLLFDFHGGRLPFVIAIGILQCLAVFFQFPVDVGQVPVDLLLVEVVLLAVLCPQFGGVPCDQCCTYQPEVPGDRDRCTEHPLDRPGLSLLKLLMVLWSGQRLSRIHMTSMLRLHSRSSCLLERILFM